MTLLNSINVTPTVKSKKEKRVASSKMKTTGCGHSSFLLFDFSNAVGTEYSSTRLGSRVTQCVYLFCIIKLLKALKITASNRFRLSWLMTQTWFSTRI